jgi:hypothetical protein
MGNPVQQFSILAIIMNNKLKQLLIEHQDLLCEAKISKMLNEVSMDDATQLTNLAHDDLSEQGAMPQKRLGDFIDWSKEVYRELMALSGNDIELAKRASDLLSLRLKIADAIQSDTKNKKVSKDSYSRTSTGIDNILNKAEGQ